MLSPLVVPTRLLDAVTVPVIPVVPLPQVTTSIAVALSQDELVTT